MYKVVGIVKNGIKVEFYKGNEEIIFQTEEEAEQFIEDAQRDNVFPENYKLIVKKTGI
ncbi:hypothetical protein [Sediminibacillus massiliensis]|uniref:hypothetical protein n=1 Tax=Sediminibacillus massiliensis TaxID=1926277 RepID=UPI0015C2E2CE|nr:hypothetical protein [Sediminibacillus massiliensis]